jgi:hypothetical protein
VISHEIDTQYVTKAEKNDIREKCNTAQKRLTEKLVI